MVAGFLGADDITVVSVVVRVRLLEGFEREDDVFRLDRLAVVKAGFRAQAEGGARKVVGKGDPFGHKTVFGRGFVWARGHQCIIDEADARRRAALHGEGVEAVEGAHGPLAHGAALGRIRIDPVEVFEIRSVCWLADERKGVMPCLAACRKTTNTGAKGHCRCGERQKTSAYATVDACGHTILPPKW